MAHLQLEPSTKEMQERIQNCLDCYDLCAQTEAHCLKLGGKHSESKHIQLLKDCADICKLAADFMLRSSDRYAKACAVCAEICVQCAKDCERFPEDKQMAKCAEICASCAESCRRMA